MYYPEGMKARVSPVQSIEPHRILAPTRDSNQEPPGPESRVVNTILPLHTIGLHVFESSRYMNSIKVVFLRQSTLLSKRLTLRSWLRYRWIAGVEADLSTSLWLLACGRGLYTVHKCVVFTYFWGSIIASMYWVVITDVLL